MNAGLCGTTYAIDAADRALSRAYDMIYLVIYLVRPPGETTPQRDLGIADLVHEEAHPVVPNPR